MSLETQIAALAHMTTAELDAEYRDRFGHRPRYRSPARAVGLTVLVGGLATLSGRTDALITLSVLGALGVYVVSMLAVIKLRRSEPGLERPFRAPLHPWLPSVAIALSLVAFVSVGVGSPAVVAAWLVHGAHLHAETGLSFGVVSGGDTKFPDRKSVV